MYYVMIVEDEKIIRNGIAGVVERFGNGMQVKWECADAYSAWEQFQTEQPDIVITDIVMRGMSGIDLVRKIREYGSQIPVVILSGYAEFTYAQNAIQLGVCEYALKPMNVRKFNEILMKLKHILDEQEGVQPQPNSLAADDIEDSNFVIRQAEEYMRQHLGGDLSLTAVAERVKLSPNYLSMLFKAKTGQKYTECVLRMRMEKAKQLLEHSEFKIYEIAEICGYSNGKHFISAFKKYVGVTPTQYKNKPSSHGSQCKYSHMPGGR